MRTGPCDSFWLIFKLILSFVGTVSGLSIFIVFMFMYHNYHAAVWGFVSGLFSFSVFHLNYLYMKNKIDEWYDPPALENLKLMGLLVFLGSIVSSGVYLSMAITKKQDPFVVSDYSYYPAAIFSFLSMKWSFILFINAKKYKKYVQMCSPEFVYSIWKNYG